MSTIDYLGGFYFRCGSERVETCFCLPYHQLVVFTCGRYDAAIGPERLEARGGEILLFRAGTSRVEGNDPDDPPEFFVLNFAWSDLPPDLPIRVRDHDGRIRLLASWLNESWHWNTPCDAFYCVAILQAILGEYMHLAMEPSHPLRHHIRTFIREHLDEPLTLEQLAAEAGLSPTHFARKYRQLSGHAPMAEVRGLKIDRAVYLLRTTQLPLKAIAEAIGVASASSLSHLFRKYVKRTPNQVRRAQGWTKSELLAGDGLRPVRRIDH